MLEKTANYAFYMLHQKDQKNRIIVMKKGLRPLSCCGLGALWKYKTIILQEECQIHKQTLNFWEMSYSGC